MGNLAQTIDQSPHQGGPEHARVALPRSARRTGYRRSLPYEASADEVVAHLLDSVRGTELALLKVFGDGDRVYPFESPDLAWSLSASSWRAELFWHSPTFMSGWRLEIFLKRAEIFLGLPGRVRRED